MRRLYFLFARCNTNSGDFKEKKSTNLLCIDNRNKLPKFNSSFLQHASGEGIAGACVRAAIFITCHQIYQYLRYYTNPAEQRLIVRILFIVPIYAVES